MDRFNVVTWYIPGQVIYIGWGFIVSIDDVGTVSDRVNALLDTATGPVYVLSDTRRVRHHPQHPLQLRHAMTFLDHPRLHALTSVAGNAVMRFLATVVPQMTTYTDNRVYGRLDSALEHLQALKLREPLDWARADAGVFVQPLEADVTWPQQVGSAS